MKEEDKILISAFMDGETSEEENAYVESLIDSDEQAHLYFQRIKELELKSEDYFSKSLKSASYKSANQKINALIKDESKSGSFFGGLFEKRLNLIHAGVPIALLLVIFLVPMTEENSLSGFQTEIFEQNYIKTRGSNEISSPPSEIIEGGLEASYSNIIEEDAKEEYRSTNNAEAIISDAIKKMIEVKKKESLVTYGDLKIRIILTSKTAKNDLSCFFGKVIDNQDDRNFQYCTSEKESNLFIY